MCQLRRPVPMAEKAHFALRVVNAVRDVGATEPGYRLGCTRNQKEAGMGIEPTMADLQCPDGRSLTSCSLR